MSTRTTASITPSAARLTDSLRDIGYDFPAAVADIVDNSISAGARRVHITIEFDGSDSRVFIADDGSGMSANSLLEALRYGSRRDYGKGDLGRYGLGLKTASLSQCRSVTVATRSSTTAARVSVRTLDLDLIAETDAWLVIDPGQDEVISRARSLLMEGTGTVVVWEKLDRVLPEKRPDGGWARRRLESMAARVVEHLGIVFHRYLEGVDGRDLVITVNGNKVEPWNPFATDESSCVELAPQQFEITFGEASGKVLLRRFVLPARDQFSSPDNFDRMSGPHNWNRQQGFYIYRASRLVQWGGWNGLRGIDEHTKLARASLDFDTDLDSAFNINVAKMRVAVPPQLRVMLDRPINELCSRADDAYRKTSRRREPQTPADQVPMDAESTAGRATTETGLALRAAAMQAGEYASFLRIVDILRVSAPEIAFALGLAH
jgi:Histidine kinase-, DNA gyrase B-, and HSP90-like ATPase